MRQKKESKNVREKRSWKCIYQVSENLFHEPSNHLHFGKHNCQVGDRSIIIFCPFAPQFLYLFVLNLFYSVDHTLGTQKNQSYDLHQLGIFVYTKGLNLLTFFLTHWTSQASPKPEEKSDSSLHMNLWGMYKEHKEPP